MKLLLLLLLLAPLVLAGCAYDVAKRSNTTGNEVGVTVNNVWNANQALPIADAHCHRYGKAARLTVSREFSFSFDCIATQ